MFSHILFYMRKFLRFILLMGSVVAAVIGSATELAVSQDDEWGIIFWATHADPTSEIYLVDENASGYYWIQADGINLTQIVSEARIEEIGSVLLDEPPYEGRYLLADGTNAESLVKTLLIYDLATDAVESIGSFYSEGREAIWSPDGTQVAYLETVSYTPDGTWARGYTVSINLVDVVSGEVHPLSVGAAPEGRVFFPILVTDEFGHVSVSSVLEGEVFFPGPQFASFTWSATGTHLVFLHANQMPASYDSSKQYAITLIELATGEQNVIELPEALVPETADLNFQPQVSMSEDSIYFQCRGADGRWTAICAVNPTSQDTSLVVDATEISPDIFRVGNLDVHPEGGQIAFTVQEFFEDTSRGAIYSYNLETGEPHRIHEGAVDQRLSWSHRPDWL